MTCTIWADCNRRDWINSTRSQIPVQVAVGEYLIVKFFIASSTSKVPSWCMSVRRHVHMEYLLPLPLIKDINHVHDRADLPKY